MAINLYQTHTMLAAVRQMTPVQSFLRDRYFPSTSADIFPTEDVLVEFKDVSGNLLAPVVVPRKGSLSVERDGYSTERLTPPLVAPSRPLTIDILTKKGFGENLFSDKTPAERQSEILIQDLSDFDRMLANREEYMASQVIFTNGCSMKQWIDKPGTTEFVPYDLKFYNGVNDATAVISTKWDAAEADPFADLYKMILMLLRNGNDATEVLLGSNVAEALLDNAKVKERMDLRNYDAGSIRPITLAKGAARLGALNVHGHMIDLLTYDGTYVNEDTGAVETFVPANKIALGAPGAGRALYGAVTQMEQADGQFHTYKGRRVPQYWANKSGRDLTVSSHPLLVPKTKNPFIVADALA